MENKMFKFKIGKENSIKLKELIKNLDDRPLMKEKITEGLNIFNYDYMLLTWNCELKLYNFSEEGIITGRFMGNEEMIGTKINKNKVILQNIIFRFSEKYNDNFYKLEVNQIWENDKVKTKIKLFKDNKYCSIKKAKEDFKKLNLIIKNNLNPYKSSLSKIKNEIKNEIKIIREIEKEEIELNKLTKNNFSIKGIRIIKKEQRRKIIDLIYNLKRTKRDYIDFDKKSKND